MHELGVGSGVDQVSRGGDLRACLMARQIAARVRRGRVEL
ncbi:putative arginyl-tRNA--transferase domain protein [Bordetella holmesii ATCC 51541]|nr:putative arginyl-tRNA--transferase domain protein [Bordetella holmesii ATCC 51541]